MRDRAAIARDRFIRATADPPWWAHLMRDAQTSKPQRIRTLAGRPRRLARRISTLAGIYDVMNGPSLMGLAGPGAKPPFVIEIVGDRPGALPLASGVPIEVQRAIDDVASCDIVIVPSVL